MCGIGGILLREPGPIGEQLVRMCEAMRHRGIDSTGFALYRDPDRLRELVRRHISEAHRVAIELIAESHVPTAAA